MCGLTGFWSFSTDEPSQVVRRMTDVLTHRGPDDSGIWVDNESGIALGHRRLSIMDLSPAGHQPMLSRCGRFVLVFNGEIYNHLDIRKELEKCTSHLELTDRGNIAWRGHSDTETLLMAISCWGLEKTLNKTNGMFAFALWDRESRKLILARDRMGEKPLYYGRSGDTFLFASELKALKAHPHWIGQVDRDVMTLFLRHNYVPAPWSIYKDINKLSPGHYVVIENAGRLVNTPSSYWNLLEKAEQGYREASGNPETLADELDGLLRDAVGKRMLSDVPLGAFLSGGLDSSMVVAQMQAQSSQPVKTFTIGFDESGYNEATHAKAVAEHLGTEHTELYVTPEQAQSVIPQLPQVYDEPFSDSSQIPTLLVSELAKRYVTVSLSGDGGDELFFGYQRYFLGERVWRKLAMLPEPLRQSLASLLGRFPGKSLDSLQRWLPSGLRVNNLQDRLPKLAELLSHPDSTLFYRDLVSHWKKPQELVYGSVEPNTILSQPDSIPELGGLPDRMMLLDMLTYLPDDILTKVDRASMAVGLEARVPMLDHRLVEFAWKVPTRFKYQDQQGKWLLRKVLYRYLPRRLMERPKMGFGIPIEHWLCGPLRDWAENLLDEKRLSDGGFFNPVPIRQMWKEHLSGARRWHYYLWDVLMFQAWLEQQK